MYRPSRYRYRTYHCVEAKYPVSWGDSIGPRMERCETPELPIPMVPRLQKCITLLGANTVLTTAWPQTTPFHGGYRAQSGNMRKFAPTLPHGTALAPK